MCDEVIQQKSASFKADSDMRTAVVKQLKELEQYEENLKAPVPMILPTIYQAARGLTAQQVYNKMKKAKYFSSRMIAYAVQKGITVSDLRSYMATFNADFVKEKLNVPVACDRLGFAVPVLFFAVENGDPQYIRMLHAAGADLEARTTEFDIAILPYTALHYNVAWRDTTEVFRTLIGLGADPAQVPKSMWENYVEPLAGRITEPTNNRLRCMEQIENQLSNSLNLSQRYLLNMADAHGAPEAPTIDMKDAARICEFTKMMAIPYSIVGQRYALKMLMEFISGYFINMIYKAEPLSIILTGASGHGKTELAEQMGTLLNCELYHVNCASMTTEAELFGPRPPYIGGEVSRGLNKFLRENEGKRCIVFLDEFEKTKPAVLNSLLVPLDKGKYTDRVDNHELEPCLNTIWIMAANASVDTCTKFYNDHKGADFLETAPFIGLQETLRQEFVDLMGAPMTGRIGEIFPYFPFTPEEAAALACDVVLKYVRMCREPFSSAKKKVIGDLLLEPSSWSELCKHLASFYNPVLGARSIKQAVNRELKRKVAQFAMRGSKGLVRDPEANRSLKRAAVNMGEERISKARKFDLSANGRVLLPCSLEKSRELVVWKTAEWEVIERLSGGTIEEEVQCAKCTKMGHSEDSCPV
jgi:hypothetical protein